LTVRFSPDGQLLASGGGDKVKIWRVADGTLVRTLTNPYFFSVPSHKVTWTRDGRYVVTAFTTGNDPSRIRFWNFATGELVREYRSVSVQESIRSLDFSPDGRTFTFDLGQRVILARNPFAPAASLADFDGDGRSDISVYRGEMWYLRTDAENFASVRFGLPTDKLAPADFDGDGKSDIAVFRDGTWYIWGSSRGFYAFQFGIASDKPVAADYDGDGKTDPAVFRDGVWYLLRSQAGLGIVQFGITDDQPVQSAFVP
jgi:WD40 repeat protein